VKQQVEFLQDWCKKQGYTIIKIVSDEESGRLALVDRKKFNKLLNDSLLQESNIEAIIIHNLDRLTRNWVDQAVIEKFFTENWNKVKLISASDSIDLSNASGRLTFRIRMAVSCYEPENIREKQKIGISRAQLEGRYKKKYWSSPQQNPKNIGITK
jgi:DNA invertase Pin-like site-specific DNA recombinase